MSDSLEARVQHLEDRVRTLGKQIEWFQEQHRHISDQLVRLRNREVALRALLYAELENIPATHAQVFLDKARRHTSELSADEINPDFQRPDILDEMLNHLSQKAGH